MKKKILIVNDMLQGGGVEKLMYDLVWQWHKKYDITILTYDYCEGARELYPADVKYMSASLRKEYKRNVVEKVFNKIRKKIYGKRFQHRMSRGKFDIAIAIKDGWIMKKVAEMDYIPVKYAWIHTDYSSYYYTYDIFGNQKNELKYMKRFKNVVCVSESIKKSIVNVIGDPGNLLVKYNPIDVKQIVKKAREPVVDVESRPEPGVTRFLTVGRLNHQKGYDLLLEACHMLEREGFKFEVWIVGAKEPWGDEHNRLERARKRMDVQCVKFLGGRKNPYKYIKCADWFLSSSIFEGYSLVSQEAAVLDIPLLLTDCSGVRELVGDNEYGMVMEISVIGIYEGMKRVIEHPELQSYYKQKIMERKTIITFEERIHEIEKLFQ